MNRQRLVLLALVSVVVGCGAAEGVPSRGQGLVVANPAGGDDGSCRFVSASIVGTVTAEQSSSIVVEFSEPLFASGESKTFGILVEQIVSPPGVGAFSKGVLQAVSFSPQQSHESARLYFSEPQLVAPEVLRLSLGPAAIESAGSWRLKLWADPSGEANDFWNDADCSFRTSIDLTAE